MSDQLRAPTILSPGNGCRYSLDRSLSEPNFVQGVRIGACGHPHVSRRSHFFIWVRMKVNSKFLGTSHIPMLATYPTQAVLHTDMLLHSKYLIAVC
jgi:hypothetical protein